MVQLGQRCCLMALTVAAIACSVTAFDGNLQTACGKLEGKELNQAPGTWAFRALRYAEPPVGELRFKPPQPPKCSHTEHVFAKQNGQVCSQKNPIVGMFGDRKWMLGTPRMTARIYSGILLLFAFTVTYFMLTRRNKVAQELHGGDSQALLLYDRRSGKHKFQEFGVLDREIAFCVVCTIVLAAFIVGGWLLIWSFKHHLYLGAILGGEDCLFMNIYAHESVLANPKAAALPVFVFVHGGDLTLGSGTDAGPAAIYGGSWAMAASGRGIAVQFNYRLNALGFMYLEDEKGEAVFGDSTNMGLLDQIQALKWVQQHIAEFGGDPNKVTLYGQSSGGTSIAALLASPMAKGLFHRALSMSASPRIDATPAQASDAWSKYLLSHLSGCDGKKTAADLRKCLYDASAEDIVGAMDMDYSDPEWADYLPTDKELGKVIYMAFADGKVIAGNVSAVLSHRDPRLPAVPTIFGNVREEEDLALDQVRKTTVFQNVAWPFTPENVKLWGLQLTGSKEFGEEVWKLYEPTSLRLPRERWAQLTSDMRSICGNIYNSRQLARSQDAPVYFYLFTHRPQGDVKSHVAGWPAWVAEDSSRLAFHTWDIMLLFNGTAGYSKDDYLTYKFKPLDYVVADRFREQVFEFANTGQIASWHRIDEKDQVVCRIDTETTCDKLLRKKECELFERYNISYPNWIVN